MERHHLFPKAYLRTLGITATRDTNQIANFALVEWGDNNRIADQPPKEYLPAIKARFTQAELEQMYRHHALPHNWEYLDYRDFLERRREIMGQVIAEGYAGLTPGRVEEDAGATDFDLSEAVLEGESEAVEFKATLRTNLHTGSKDPRIELAVLKTLTGFLNGNGGTLIIGVSDPTTAPRSVSKPTRSPTRTRWRSTW